MAKATGGAAWSLLPGQQGGCQKSGRLAPVPGREGARVGGSASGHQGLYRGRPQGLDAWDESGAEAVWTMTQPAPPPPGGLLVAAAWPLEQRLACCRHQPNLGADDILVRCRVWAPSALLSSEHSEAKPIHVPASGRCPVTPSWPPPGSLLPPFLLFPAEEALETRPCWGWCFGHLWGQEKEGACSLPHARHPPVSTHPGTELGLPGWPSTELAADLPALGPRGRRAHCPKNNIRERLWPSDLLWLNASPQHLPTNHLSTRRPEAETWTNVA